MVRRPAALDQEALRHLVPLLLRARDHEHRGSQRPESLHDTLARLRDAGLDSLPGGGAEILDDEVRHRISRLKCATQDWIDVHRTCHALGMRTTATMMFGTGETIEQRMNHFDIVRQIQEDTGGFTAFIPWSFQRENYLARALRQGRSHRGRVSEDAGACRGSTSRTSSTSSPPG